MIKKIKKNLFIFLPILLISYFILNLLSGNRGLFSYFEKKGILEKLQSENKKSNSAIRIELPAKDNPKLKREDPLL